MNKFTCPCCGEKTLDELNDYEICEICGWEDDPGQSKFPDDDLGANSISLNQYRAEWESKKTTNKNALYEQLISIIREKNIPTVQLECNEDGELIVDKEKYPEIYDWLENG